MKDIAIYGAGGFGREVLALIKDINKVQPTWNFIGFFDDGRNIGDTINGFSVLGNIESLNNWETPLSVVVAIGTPRVKQVVVDRICNDKVDFPTIIHPSVIIGDSDFVSIGKGCIICAANILTTNIEIKDFVIINLACTIGHDTVINDYAAFMPSCNVSGEVVIEKGVYCGTGVKIINQVSIGEYSIIGAGAVVAKNQPGHATIVGVPAKVIKTNPLTSYV